MFHLQDNPLRYGSGSDCHYSKILQFSFGDFRVGISVSSLGLWTKEGMGSGQGHRVPGKGEAGGSKRQGAKFGKSKNLGPRHKYPFFSEVVP